MQELKLEDILANTQEIKEKKVGYVAIIGRPNAGKSTFINSLLDRKISIVTNTPQTTRKRVLAIYNDEESQIIFFDTPGIHKENKVFNELINKQAISSMREADCVLYFIDSSRISGPEERYIEELVGFVNVPVIKIYTKSDLRAKIKIPEGDSIVKISSVNKDGFPLLLNKVKSNLEVGHTFYPDDYYTSQDMYFRISEIVREKVFLYTKEEIPHSTFIEVEEIEDTEDLLKVVAYVNTETDSQRYIVIGKGGKLIQKIGTEARLDLEKIFEKKVFIAVRVKTREKWRKNEGVIKKILR